MMMYQLQFLLLVLAGWVNRQQQDVIDYLREENRVLRAGLRGKRLSFLTMTGAVSPPRPRRWAARRWPSLRPLPRPLRFCAGTATSLRPSTMAARAAAQADRRRRRTSLNSLYASRRRTRRGATHACGAHSRTSDMKSDATPSRGSSPTRVSHRPRSGAKACR